MFVPYNEQNEKGWCTCEKSRNRSFFRCCRRSPDGTYSVRFGMSEYQLAAPVKVTVQSSNISGLDIHLSTPVYDVSGSASSGGQPLSYQSIIIEDSTGTYGGSYFNQTMTGSDGAFDIHGLPNGTYTILIGVDMSKPISSPDNQALASKTITIQDGRLTDVKVGN